MPGFPGWTLGAGKKAGVTLVSWRRWFHPGPSMIPLVRPWFDPGSTPVRPRFDPGSNLVQPSFDPCSTRVQPWFDPGSTLGRPRLDLRFPGGSPNRAWSGPLPPWFDLGRLGFEHTSSLGSTLARSRVILERPWFDLNGLTLILLSDMNRYYTDHDNKVVNGK